MSEMCIRGYRPDDLERLYEICLRTGAAGDDASELVDDDRLLGEIWAAPYAVLEPEHTHILDDGTGRAVGYILGTRDAVAFEERCQTDWWPALRERYPKVDQGDRLDDLLIALIHDRPGPRADLREAYPSELHIDLLPEAQGQGWGRLLMQRLFVGLREAGSPGVHLGVSVGNSRAVPFYRHLGFHEIDCDGITYTFAISL